MKLPLSYATKVRVKSHAIAMLAVLLMLVASLWPMAQGRILAQSGPLAQILCAGQARTALSAEAHQSLERLAALTGERDLLPAAQTPLCPCQGCFTHGHGIVSILPTPVLAPVRMARLSIYRQAMQARLRPSQSVVRAHGARAPPTPLVFA
jgi:hypothetical protein